MATRKGRRADGSITTRTVPAEEIAADSARDAALAAEIARLGRINTLLVSVREDLASDATNAEIAARVNLIAQRYNGLVKAMRGVLYSESAQ